jgi:hypothetical protein
VRPLRRPVASKKIWHFCNNMAAKAARLSLPPLTALYGRIADYSYCRPCAAVAVLDAARKMAAAI